MDSKRGSARWALACAAGLSFAPVAARAEPTKSSDPPASSIAFELGLGLGFSLHSGRYSNFGAGFPVTVDAGLRWPDFQLGVYGAYAPIFAGHCAANCPTDSSANLTRAGVLVRMAFPDGSLRPWIGSQLGLFWIRTRETYPLTASSFDGAGVDTGFDVGAWAGIDASLSHEFALGPYVLVDYSAVWGDAGAQGALWFSFGLRGAVDLAF